MSRIRHTQFHDQRQPVQPKTYSDKEVQNNLRQYTYYPDGQQAQHEYIHEAQEML